MEKKLNIELAGQEYVIRPLTVGQLEAIHIEMTREALKEDVITQFWKINVATIAAALSSEHAEMTVEAVQKLRLGNIKTVKKIVEDIRIFAGLVERVEKKDAAEEASNNSGEAPAIA
jgi:tetrahydromethanopterin S-methyltransferase subunit F